MRDVRIGTEIFGPHPDLVKQIVSWFMDTLITITAPANPAATFTPKKTAIAEFWALANEPGGADKATHLFHEARARDPKALLFPESAAGRPCRRAIQGPAA